MDENLSGAFDEEQYLYEQAKKELNALSDAEFYAWIASIEKDEVNGNLQSTQTAIRS